CARGPNYYAMDYW
nr:immunoglobulin heavy chain junction region [Mus musculus]